MSGLLRFAGVNEDYKGRKLFWGRAGQDGAPFRGDAIPQYTEEEFETRVHRVMDARNGTFNTGDPKQNMEFLQVMDRIANNWAVAIVIKRRWPRNAEHPSVYIEWFEYYLEDGTPTQGVAGHGQPKISGPLK